MENFELKKYIADRLAEKVSLSDIQKEITEKFNVRMTFFELRVLAAELENIDWTQFDPVKTVKDEKSTPKKADIAAGKTQIEISKIVRPGALISGTVKFASGVTAEWMVDQMGRLGLDNNSGQPTEEDIKEFQTELQQAISARGGM
ncbi:MAG: hypothetical protein RRY34_02085 [Victivallaceae bacterium]